jgi:hypothetical protein
MSNPAVSTPGRRLVETPTGKAKPLRIIRLELIF